MTLRKIKPSEIYHEWAKVRHWILNAADKAGEADEPTILGDVLLEKYHLFVVEEASGYLGALTVDIQEYPLRKVAHVVHLGSADMSRMEPYFPELVEWARSHGATAFRLFGRKGFVRRLAPLGFELKYCVMEKEI